MSARYSGAPPPGERSPAGRPRIVSRGAAPTRTGSAPARASALAPRRNGRVLELRRNARGDARAGAPPRRADRVLHAPRASRAATAAVGGGRVERGGALAHRHGDGRVWGGLLCDAAQEHGPRLCKTGAWGVGSGS